MSGSGALPLLGIYLKKMKTVLRKDTCTPIFIAALFTVAKIWKQSKCPSINEWVKKIWYVCIYSIYIYIHTHTHTHTMDIHIYIYIYIYEYYSAIKKKKNEILPFVTIWVDVEGTMLNEINQRKTNAI